MKEVNRKMRGRSQRAPRQGYPLRRRPGRATGAEDRFDMGLELCITGSL